MAQDDDRREPDRPRRRSSPGDFEDEALRKMLNRAGFDPEKDADVQRFADQAQFIGEAIKRREAVRKKRTSILIWFFGIVGTGIIGALINQGVLWLKP